ncbi:recombinase family protein [Sphingomonas folli]|uniref:recombinase family protein n=1 Tax=Sphingomonas folli TaxID=2862497 RepID=UPI0027E527DD|nr:recombinase family protein [Sphingomonas folli]
MRCERGISLLSLKESIDTSRAVGKLIFHLSGAMIHFGRRLTSERTFDGVAAARTQGKPPAYRPGKKTRPARRPSWWRPARHPQRLRGSSSSAVSTMYRKMKRPIARSA